MEIPGSNQTNTFTKSEENKSNSMKKANGEQFDVYDEQNALFIEPMFVI